MMEHDLGPGIPPLQDMNGLLEPFPQRQYTATSVHNPRSEQKGSGRDKHM